VKRLHNIAMKGINKKSYYFATKDNKQLTMVGYKVDYFSHP